MISQHIARLRGELDSLRGEDGRYFPDAILDWAKAHPKSELHRQLDWDDASAAHAHRLDQVRRLIRLHVVDAGGAPRLINLRIDRPSGGGYRERSAVMRERRLVESLVEEAYSELARLRDKYAFVKSLSLVWQSIDVAMKKRAAIEARSRRPSASPARKAPATPRPAA